MGSYRSGLRRGAWAGGPRQRSRRGQASSGDTRSNTAITARVVDRREELSFSPQSTARSTRQGDRGCAEQRLVLPIEIITKLLEDHPRWVDHFTSLSASCRRPSPTCDQAAETFNWNYAADPLEAHELHESRFRVCIRPARRRTSKPHSLARLLRSLSVLSEPFPVCHSRIDGASWVRASEAKELPTIALEGDRDGSDPAEGCEPFNLPADLGSGLFHELTGKSSARPHPLVISAVAFRKQPTERCPRNRW